MTEAAIVEFGIMCWCMECYIAKFEITESARAKFGKNRHRQISHSVEGLFGNGANDWFYILIHIVCRRLNVRSHHWEVWSRCQQHLRHGVSLAAQEDSDVAGWDGRKGSQLLGH